jgi:hypothetical protein
MMTRLLTLTPRWLCRRLRPVTQSGRIAARRGHTLAVQQLEPRLACSVTTFRSNADVPAGPQTTAVVRVGTIRNGTINHAGDRDWLAVSLVAGREYAFAAHRQTLAVPDVVLRDPQGTALATGEMQPGGYDAWITHRCVASGTYYLDVGSATATGVGRYDVAAADVTPLDDGQAGVSATGRVSVGGSVMGTVELPGDRDWFAVDLVARQPYRFRLTGTTLPNPSLFLRDATGAMLAYNDDASGRDAEIVFTPTADGTLWLDAGGRAGTGHYALDVTPAQSGPDPGDDAGIDAGTANALSVGGDARGIVHVAGDHDRFAIAVEAGRTYRFSVGSTDLTQVNAALFDARGAIIRTVGSDGRLEFSPTGVEGGTCMLEVSAGPAEVGSYRIECIDVTPGVDRIPGLRDAAIRSAVNRALSDFVITRQEIVSLVTLATRLGPFSAQRLADLRAVSLQMVPYLPASRAAYEQFILHAVLFGNPANAWWTGGNSTRIPLGNLTSGNAFLVRSRLIGKWYAGADLPTNYVSGDSAADATAVSFTYAAATGPVFVDGARAVDVDQGWAGTCYLLAAAGAITATRPAVVEDMFLDNGDGTYGVRFLTSTQAEIWVTVDRRIPSRNGTILLAAGAERSWAGELWPALLEKAYAQANEMGLFGRPVAANSYRWIEGGLDDALVHIGGGERTRFVTADEFLHGSGNESSAQGDPANWSRFLAPAMAASAAGRSLIFGCFGTTRGANGRRNLVPFHGFAIVGAGTAADSFVFVNPWGATAKTGNHVFEESWSGMFQASGWVSWTDV